MSHMNANPDISVVIPALNERESLDGLLEEVAAACDGAGYAWEAIVVDDGSTDGTFDLLREISRREQRVRPLRLRRNFGKSMALAAGFGTARGGRIVTLDGDGQDDPAEIPALLAALSDGADLVSGWKRERRDPFTRRLASGIFNRVSRRLSGLALHDMNCGLKAYRRECALSLELYGEMHRFLPVLAAQQGWRVAELPVAHRERSHGRSRFGRERYLRGALDLLTVSFLGRYENRPLHLFGGIGLLLATVGVAISVYLTILKIGGEAIGQRPLLVLGVLLIVVGVQFLSLGLLGQLMVLARRGRDSLRTPEDLIVAPEAEAPPRAGASGSERSARETRV